jgi:hypothetical protein
VLQVQEELPSGEFELAGQDVQPVAAFIAEYFPSGQFVHDATLPGEYVPTPQFWHDAPL